ncbi:MAG: HEAT repeat domain-containing protein [Thermoguttaceae bacterium]
MAIALGVFLAPPAPAATAVNNIEDGYRRAIADRKPLLVCVGAKWSEPSRKLLKELTEGAVATELARWVLVTLDLEVQAADVEELGVVTAPALRIFSPTGQHVAAVDRYLPPQELLAWLQKNHEAAMAPADDVLLATGEPNVMAVIKLVKQFDERNPALREAAIRRLTPYPEVSQAAVVKAFTEGGLSARLAAAEVLDQWRAPLDGLDPWRPETFTRKRLARLEQWKPEAARSANAAPLTLTADQLAAARAEIERLLRADEKQADAASHRLARLGPALLPAVYARLKDAASDQDRTRLLVLRYRLAADSALALAWPGGIERLADRNPRQRQKAADELARRATAAEQGLLLELFADPDPLVREISLRGLQHIGGRAANAALVRLLDDPDPNVRVAVLKQLEASPSAAMGSAIVKYLKREKDPDLIGHGIRVLQAASGSEAVKCLVGLLKHDAWQVRAEAAVAIGKVVGGGSGFHYRPSSYSTTAPTADEATKLAADVYVALLDLLDDPEPFVVAKAVEGLSGADMAVAVEPLAKAAVKHPDLAPTILAMLARGGAMRPKAMPHLQKFVRHQDPKIRAAAIVAICSVSFDQAEDAMLAGLGDKDSGVRLESAVAAIKAMDSIRESAVESQRDTRRKATELIQQSPRTDGDLLSTVAKLLGGGKSAKKTKSEAAKPADPSAAEKKDGKGSKAKPAEKSDAKKKAAAPDPETSWWDQWLQGCYAGKQRPAWTGKMVPPLEKMLKAESAKERVAAAVLLAPLGKANEALPVLEQAVREQPELIEQAVKVLPWLLWEDRLRAFRSFHGSATTDDARRDLLGGIGSIPDPRSAELIWEMLADPYFKVEVSPYLMWTLNQVYLGTAYMPSDVPPAARRRAIEDARSRTQSGGDWQRRAALALLATLAKEEAAETAAKIADDPKASEGVRIDAFQVQLASQSDGQARRLAMAALRGNEPKRRTIGLRYLAHGSGALSTLPSGLMLMTLGYSWTSTNDGHPIVPQPPAGLKPEDVLGLMKDKDAETAANAGYLAVLLGRNDGMAPLLRYWQAGPERRDSSEWARAVYRAIAVTDDPQYIPVLREIRAKLQTYEMSEFYWTIRIMSGEEILKFRKEVRDAMKQSNSF